MSSGRALIMEIMFDFCVLFVSYGVALDPSQGQVFGPVLAPFFVSTTLAMCIFASSLLADPPFTGASMNPSRCFGPAIALADYYEWEGKKHRPSYNLQGISFLIILIRHLGLLHWSDHRRDTPRPLVRS